MNNNSIETRIYDLPDLEFQLTIKNWIFRQMFLETSFQIINIYTIGGQNRTSELLWH
jgi:hypothetical protein